MEQLWETLTDDFGELRDSEEFEKLTLEAKVARLDEAVDGVILRLCRTKLVMAATDRELIIFRAEVLALFQLRNALIGKINGGK